MNKKLLFPQLSREHAIQLQRMVNSNYSNEEREQQVRALGVFLAADGMSYGSQAILDALRDLAPYTSKCLNEGCPGYPAKLKTLPDCVIKAYRLMFEALDDCLNRIIKEHWEVEVWTDSEGTDIKYCSTFYNQEEAYEEYRAEQFTGGYARLIHVDEVTHDFNILEVTWTEGETLL